MDLRATGARETGVPDPGKWRYSSIPAHPVLPAKGAAICEDLFPRSTHCGIAIQREWNSSRISEVPLVLLARRSQTAQVLHLAPCCDADGNSSCSCRRSGQQRQNLRASAATLLHQLSDSVQSSYIRSDLRSGTLRFHGRSRRQPSESGHGWIAGSQVWWLLWQPS